MALSKRRLMKPLYLYLKTKTHQHILKPPKFHSPSKLEADDSQSNIENHSKHIRKPAQRVRDLLSGKGVASNLPKGPKIAVEVQLPTSDTSTDTALEGEQADFSDEYLLVAEISDMKP